MPAKTHAKKWYTVKCSSRIFGQTIKLVTTRKVNLSLSGFEAHGFIGPTPAPTPEPSSKGTFKRLFSRGKYGNFGDKKHFNKLYWA